MIRLNWGLRKARIWLDRLPDWQYQVAEVIERHQPVLQVENVPSSCAAVELFVPVGPRAYYGGLGATFVSENVHQLLIRVSTSADKGRLLNDSLAGTMDKAYIGCPKEYVSGIFNGVMGTDLAPLLGNGTLHFCRTVHGDIGSSPWMFQALSRIVIRLLCVDKRSTSQENLIVLLQQELSWRA